MVVSGESRLHPMTASPKADQLHLRLPLRRTAIRARAHAAELAQQIAYGDLLRNGGSVSGFADWLFMNRKTFNGANPLQQVAVYVHAFQHAASRGVDFDAQCRQRADELEDGLERARMVHEAHRATIQAYWTETPVGPDMTLAIVELTLGGGYRFSSPVATRKGTSQPVWVLEWLLDLLEDFGGPDDLLERYDWMRESAEARLQDCAERWNDRLVALREQICSARPPSDTDIMVITFCAERLSALLRVRVAVRVLLEQARMAERIQATTLADASSSPAPLRRSRAV